MSLITNLVSYWKFDESSGDAADSHSTNTLTNTNTVTYVPAFLNNGADLESSSSQYFARADNAALSFIGDFSMSCRVKFESLPSASSMSIISKWLAAGNQLSYIMQYFDNAGTKSFRMVTSNDGAAVLTSTVAFVASTGVFYHVVMVYTASTGSITLYINGALIGSNTGLHTSIKDSTAQFRVGQDDAGGFFDGIIDELGVWNRVLTADDAASLYAGGAAYPYPFATNPTFSLQETTTLTESYRYDLGVIIREIVTLTETIRAIFGWVNPVKNSGNWTNEHKT